MDWTQEIPTTPGHYWMHYENNDPQVIEFRLFPDGLKCQRLDSPLSWLWTNCFLPGVSFMGPIPRPERPAKPEGETAEDVYEAMRTLRMRANTAVMGEEET